MGKHISEEKKEQFAKEAANTWCRCFKCSGTINETGEQCDKSNYITCLKWYDSYRASKIALDKLNTL